MNKVAAEIIAGLIPRKMARNRWRGILRYGVIKALKLKFRLKRDHRKPDCRLAVCAIAKDEGPYFKEWLDWHISQGVEKFYIYDNESTDCTREVLRPYIESGVVEYCYYPGYRRQIAAYDDCMDRHRFDTRWLAFIDLDEFIVPIADSSIPEFLKRFEDSPAVEINWLIYGSGGAEKKSTDPVMQRFRHHSLPGHRLNRHVKSIVDPRRVFVMTGCHEAARIDGIAADSHGDPITRNFREREPQQDVIRVNHYAVRSKEEFIEKQNRGRASGTQRTIPMDYFYNYDLNDIAE
ncbi:glycosyltransferase family 92 protein [Duncaniella muris]|uniref:glycosyltransferase family 92 protein n=2 Tax=Duncaniella muris TaxID=2094150 RepID=UPI000A5A5443|nr:glycosyltransferase family 92 protein [Duncaniella muris]